MADGGEELLIGTILGQLTQLIGIAYPIKFLGARPIVDAQGNYGRTIEVDMASGTYYVTVSEAFPLVIQEEP